MGLRLYTFHTLHKSHTQKGKTACLHLVERKKGRPGTDGVWRTSLEIQRLAKSHHRKQVLLIVWTMAASLSIIPGAYFRKSMAFSKEQCVSVFLGLWTALEGLPQGGEG